MTAPVATRGFAVIEAVIALAIVAVMMAVTYRVIGADAAADRSVRARRMAMLVAQSALDQATAAADLAGQASSGRSGALTWRTTRSGYRGSPMLERVAVEVRDPSGQPLVTLATLRLVR